MSPFQFQFPSERPFVKISFLFANIYLNSQETQKDEAEKLKRGLMRETRLRVEAFLL